jgi:ribosomal protein L32
MVKPKKKLKSRKRRRKRTKNKKKAITLNEKKRLCASKMSLWRK